MNLAKNGAKGQLVPSDLLISAFKVDWGNNEDYPLDYISFYKSGANS